jgi:hypothetical protein
VESERRRNPPSVCATMGPGETSHLAGDVSLVAHTTSPPQAARLRHSHIWTRVDNEHYVEETWCSRLLFWAERFKGCVHDPSCGWGRIVDSARLAGLVATGADIVARAPGFEVIDFFQERRSFENLVFNPPFGPLRQFICHALTLAPVVAAIFPVARLNAAHWLRETPLCRIWLLTPRPSMPPGSYILAGKKPKGGRVDFCWIVFERGYVGPPTMLWLHRDHGVSR